MKKPLPLLLLFILSSLSVFLLNNCSAKNDSFLTNIKGSYSLNSEPYILLSIYPNGNMFTNDNIIFEFEKSTGNYSAIYKNSLNYNYYPVTLDGQDLLMGGNYFSMNKVLFINMELFALKQN